MAGGWRILPNGGPFCFVYRYAASVDSMGLAEKGVLLEVLKPLDLAVFGRFWDFQKCPFFCQSHAIYRRSVPVHEAKRAPIWQNPPATRKSFRASFAPGNSRKGSGAAGCGPSGYADNGSTRLQGGPPPPCPPAPRAAPPTPNSMLAIAEQARRRRASRRTNIELGGRGRCCALLITHCALGCTLLVFLACVVKW